MSQELPDGVELPEPTVLYTTCNRFGDPMPIKGYTAEQVLAIVLADREKQAAQEPEAYIHTHGDQYETLSRRPLCNDEKARGWTEQPLYAATTTTEPSKAERTLLEQYDLDQSPEYRKGYEDGRLKGFEVGQRYAKEASKAEQADAPSGMAMMPIEPTAHLLSMIPAMTDDDAHHLYQRLIGVAQLEGVRLKVKAFGCSNETRGKSRCDSWCRADNICPASYERLDSPTQPPASNAAQDNYKVWYEEAMGASNEAGFVGASAADTIRALTRLLAAAERAALATKPQAGDVAQDKEHAENYRLIRRGQHWSVVDGIGNTLRGDDLDAAVDAIRAARSTGGQSNG